MTEITKPVTAENFEHLLDSGLLYAAMCNGRWWAMRRNGKTKTLKKRPEFKEIPFKVGFKTCGRISTDVCCIGGVFESGQYRHKDDVPDKKLNVREKPSDSQF